MSDVDRPTGHYVADDAHHPSGNYLRDHSGNGNHMHSPRITVHCYKCGLLHGVAINGCATCVGCAEVLFSSFGAAHGTAQGMSGDASRSRIVARWVR